MSKRAALVSCCALVFACGRPLSPRGYDDALGEVDDSVRISKARGFEERTRRCDEPACVGDLVRAFGGQVLRDAPPDQASAAAAAMLVRRDGRADLLPEAPAWENVLASGRGEGSDALRLAVSEKLEAWAAIERPATPLASESELRGLLAAISGVVPGLCAGYGKLGRGAPLNALAPLEHPDTSRCVRHDLEDREGPGAGYGKTFNRAATAALAAAHRTARALHGGALASSHRDLLERRLARIDAALAQVHIEVQHDVASDPRDEALRRAHERAGVPFDGGPP